MAEIGNVTVRVDAVITDEQYREAMGAVRAANERMDLLESENAKLRELVRDMHAAIGELCARQDCDACKLRDEGACERGVLTARACVLGVEVDE